MEICRVRFTVMPGSAELEAGSKRVLEACCGTDFGVVLSFWTNFGDKPLVLRAAANKGDEAELTVLPYRLELRVNGELCDEEWPRDVVLPDKQEAGGELSLQVEKSEAVPAADEPDVLRAGVPMAGLRLPGVNIGDCMPFSDDSPDSDGRLHLFYLYDRHHHTSKWGFGAHQWAHASTADLHTWCVHPMAVPITRPWEGSICTGSVIRAEGRFWAWYAIRMTDGSPARLSCSVSDDGFHFVKSETFFSLPEVYDRRSARDPKVIFFGGSYHMLVTTTLVKNGRGCLAHLKAQKLSPLAEDWTDCGAIFESPDGDQPECPDWFELDGRYYLVYGRGGLSHYLFSGDPFGASGWTAPKDNLIPCGNVPKSALLGSRRIFFGFEGENGYAGHAAAAEALPQPDGTLSFSRLTLE